MITLNEQTSCECLELTLVPFIYSDFHSVISEARNEKEMIVTGTLPGSEQVFVAKFYIQNGPKESWVSHSLEDF